MKESQILRENKNPETNPRKNEAEALNKVKSPQFLLILPGK